MKDFPVLAFAVGLDKDLSLFTNYLREKGVRNRIIEHGLEQRVHVANHEDANTVRDLYQRLDSGAVRLEKRPGAEVAAAPLMPRVIAELGSKKVVYLLILGGIIGAAIVQYDPSFRLAGLFSYYQLLDLQRADNGIAVGLFDAVRQGQPWRVITPIFLHSGLLHLVFNCMWCWDFGRRITVMQGGTLLLALALIIAVVSNASQAYVTPASLFGGLSGVVYGLLGYCWVWDLVHRGQKFAIPKPILIFMLVWLLICLTELPAALSLGKIANAAHIAGLLTGMLAALLTATLSNRKLLTAKRDRV